MAAVKKSLKQRRANEPMNQVSEDNSVLCYQLSRNNYSLLALVPRGVWRRRRCLGCPLLVLPAVDASPTYMGPIVNHSRKRSAQETDVHTTEETPNHRLRQSTWAFIHKNEPNHGPSETEGKLQSG